MHKPSFIRKPTVTDAELAISTATHNRVVLGTVGAVKVLGNPFKRDANRTNLPSFVSEEHREAKRRNTRLRAERDGVDFHEYHTYYPITTVGGVIYVASCSCGFRRDILRDEPLEDGVTPGQAAWTHLKAHLAEFDSKYTYRL